MHLEALKFYTLLMMLISMFLCIDKAINKFLHHFDPNLIRQILHSFKKFQTKTSQKIKITCIVKPMHITIYEIITNKKPKDFLKLNK